MHSIINSSDLTQEASATWFQFITDSLVKVGDLITSEVIKEIQEFTRNADDQNEKMTKVFYG